MARKRTRVFIFEHMAMLNKTGQKMSIRTFSTMVICIVVPSPGVETEANEQRGGSTPPPDLSSPVMAVVSKDIEKINMRAHLLHLLFIS